MIDRKRSKRIERALRKFKRRPFAKRENVFGIRELGITAMRVPFQNRLSPIRFDRLFDKFIAKLRRGLVLLILGAGHDDLRLHKRNRIGKPVLGGLAVPEAFQRFVFERTVSVA